MTDRDAQCQCASRADCKCAAAPPGKYLENQELRKQLDEEKKALQKDGHGGRGLLQLALFTRPKDEVITALAKA